MFKNTPFTLLILFTSNFLSAQSLNYKWAKQIGGATTTFVSVYGMAVDTSGNVYTVGWFDASMDFDPGPGIYTLNPVGVNDAFICKMGPNGNFIWAKQIGGSSAKNNGYAIALDRFQNVYVTGFFNGQSDFDPGSSSFTQTSAGANDIFILKLDTSGAFKWAKGWGGTADDYGYSIAVDLQGNIYTTGEYKGTVDFDPESGTYNLISKNNTADLFVSKLDSTGKFLWAKSMGGNGLETGRGIAVDSNGSVYTTGSFSGTAEDFDPGANVYNLASSGNYDVFVSRLDSSGNFLWAKRWGAGSTDFGYSIALDTKKNVYTTGNFIGTVDFDPGSGTYNIATGGSSAAFISKLDSSGNFIFVKSLLSIANSGFTFGYSIAVDTSGNIYTTGISYGDVDFDPGNGSFVLSAVGQNDVYISKLNSTGNFVLTKTMGGSLDDQGRRIALSPSGDVYTTGAFLGNVDFDPGTGIDTLTCPVTSIFIHKMSPCTSSSVSITNSYCDSAIINGVKYTTTGVYTQVLTNITNCDSVITLNLTIKKSSTTSASYTSCDSALFNNQKFYSSGVYTQKINNAAGCDSNLTLNITIKKSTSSLITASACNTFSLNAQTYTASGIYKQVRTNAAGCDSIITLDLTIKDTYDTITTIACSSYTLNGHTYVSSGIYTQIISNAAGCDSTITLNLTIKQPSASTLNISSCGSYLLNTQSYTSSGVYTQTILNAAGCDSVVTLNLTIKNLSFNSIYAVACTNYTLNGLTYSTSGVYSQTKTNSLGCDSVITLNLTINKSTSNFITTAACEKYTLNNQTYSMSGIYTQTQTNTWGCDSIITLNLTINNVDVSIVKNGTTLTANAIGATYQWVDCKNNFLPISGQTSKDFTASSNGDYAVIVTQNSCSDTSTCSSISGLGLMQGNISKKIKVFPNPTEGNLRITNYESQDEAVFSIYNSLGQIVLKGKLEDTQTEINILLFANGIYFLEIKDGNNISRIKILKN